MPLTSSLCWVDVWLNVAVTSLHNDRKNALFNLMRTSTAYTTAPLSEMVWMRVNNVSVTLQYWKHSFSLTPRHSTGSWLESPDPGRELWEMCRRVASCLRARSFGLNKICSVTLLVSTSARWWTPACTSFFPAVPRRLDWLPMNPLTRTGLKWNHRNRLINKCWVRGVDLRHLWVCVYDREVPRCRVQHWIFSGWNGTFVYMWVWIIESNILQWSNNLVCSHFLCYQLFTPQKRRREIAFLIAWCFSLSISMSPNSWNEFVHLWPSLGAEACRGHHVFRGLMRAIYNRAF